MSKLLALGKTFYYRCNRSEREVGRGGLERLLEKKEKIIKFRLLSD